MTLNRAGYLKEFLKYKFNEMFYDATLFESCLAYVLYTSVRKNNKEAFLNIELYTDYLFLRKDGTKVSNEWLENKLIDYLKTCCSDYEIKTINILIMPDPVDKL